MKMPHIYYFYLSFFYPLFSSCVIYCKVPTEEMSRVPIQLSGDTLYMSSTFIKVMLFIPWHPISLHEGRRWVTRTLNFFTPAILNGGKEKANINWGEKKRENSFTCNIMLARSIYFSTIFPHEPKKKSWNLLVRYKLWWSDRLRLTAPKVKWVDLRPSP